MIANLRNLRPAILPLLMCAILLHPRIVSPAHATTKIKLQESEEDNSEDKELTESEKLEAEQNSLAEKYRLLEEKLFSLHQFEKGNNPTRSKLLERAYIQSQEKMTTSQMKLIVKLLTQAKFKTAENEQELVLTNLEQLLELLQSEDRGKRVRDAIKRNQEYLKEVERILRIQKGLRGQTEGGVDPKRISNSQGKTAKRTKDLAKEIEENEEGGESDSDSSEEAGSENGSSKPSGGKSGGGKPSDQPQGSDGQGSPEDNNKDKDKKGGWPDAPNKNVDEPVQPEDENKPDNAPQSKPDDQSQSGENKQPDEPSSGQPGEGHPGQGQQGSPEGGSDPDQEQQQNPVRKRIQSAEQRMREAQKQLDDARRENAIDQMKKAERDLALAKKELEEILRQLRDEEVERTLAMLEGRFRQMLEREVRVLESTQKLNDIKADQRGTEFEIKSGKISVEQNAIATEAARALLLLKEDGSSVAFPATVEEMHQDMLQVTSRLASAKVGRITIEIEEDIVDTLNYLIKALVVTQQDLERMKQNSQQGKMGQPGDMPLVDQIAEIKMLRGLQDRIFKRHRRYSRFLEDPDDPIGSTDDPDLRAALDRLASKQNQLTEIAKDIVNEKNK